MGPLFIEGDLTTAAYLRCVTKIMEEESQKSARRGVGERLLEGWRTLVTAREMSNLYETHAKLTSKYVHACANGHEAIQIATGQLLGPQDYVFPYYRDDAMLLALGMRPEELMLQLFAKADDPFSGGRTYYSHPSLKRDGFPRIPHNSSATGMQAIPAAGVAMGLQYREQQGLTQEVEGAHAPVVVCSIGDSAMTEGEVSEALHMAALRQLPIIFLVQDNGWDISAKAEEIHFSDAMTTVKGFPGIEAISVDGHDLEACVEAMDRAMHTARQDRRPVLVHAPVPLLGHHTSGVRREWYRDDLEDHRLRDPLPHLHGRLLELGIEAEELDRVQAEARDVVAEDFDRAQAADEPDPALLMGDLYAPTPVTQEIGERSPAGGEATLMVDQALHAMQEILAAHPESLLYGQDVGRRLGGVFREAATLAEKFGDDRVFNTPIQEAFIVGSTLGMAATGCKPIVEIQFADYLWPGLNQLFTELSRSYFLSCGKWPATAVLRVPIGAYGSGGPYHSSSIESVLSNIRGIKVAYPAFGADLKGLLKSAYLDPNPVVVLEHKGLYWSKVPGTDAAKTPEPDADYLVPFGKGRVVCEAQGNGLKVCVVTYGRGVHWALEAADLLESDGGPEQIEIVDLRTIQPWDEALVMERVALCNRCLVLTEEPAGGFASAVAGKISSDCFASLDAPVRVLGSLPLPAIPLNSTLEAAVLPSAEKVAVALRELLRY